ncbi:hypothetical protein [Paraburkholderia youngii]|uniref:hypothetical protein n=1 Tax=Paraburkholderia youngii TaxID=2782701 RepID=UPI003D1DA70A
MNIQQTDEESENMGWKDIVNAIVQTDDKPRDTPPGAARQPHGPSTENSERSGGSDAPTRVGADAATPSAAGGLSVDELEGAIRAAIEQAPGFAAYLKFAEMLKKLGSVANERERYSAALGVADLPLDAVLGAVNSHQATLGAEKARFEQEFVAPTQAGIDSLKQQADALQAEVDALNQQLAKKVAEREETARKAADETASLAKKRIDFDTASSKAASYYDGIVQTLQNNLGAPANGQ